MLDHLSFMGAFKIIAEDMSRRLYLFVVINVPLRRYATACPAFRDSGYPQELRSDLSERHAVDLGGVMTSTNM